MKLPAATYRLQFRNGFDFDSAVPVLRYLKALGVSHVYASPIFQARHGSTHGYDVTDHGRPDESLGGSQGFRRFSDELLLLDLKLILDIVPNHMAASPENPWWLDVLRHGKDSAHAGFFDIDWSRGKLMLPILGKSFEEALSAGELTFGYADSSPTIRYFDQAVPLDPASWKMIFPEPMPDSDIPAHLARLSGDKALIARVHAAQHYCLADWRKARDGLGYRRFFEISDLVGVRVEEEEVFDSVHGYVFELVETGRVQGLRIDHIDGLADPAKYLADLRRKLPRPVPVWIEKILAADERLPEDWATVGTSGYEFAAMAGRLLTSGDGIDALDGAYRTFTGLDDRYDVLVATAKAEILNRNLEAELNALVRFAAESLGDVDAAALRSGIVALMSALPVYRTYFTAADASDCDRAIMAKALDEATQRAAPEIVGRLAALLTEGGAGAARFRNRFQQTSAALEAKAVEDTVFYRFNRLLSSNEVGSDPAMPAMPLSEFHGQMMARAAREPLALSATATHDTKRGEDARMRIAAISEAPADWEESVRAFDRILGAACDRCDPNMRWLFYQSLLGAWTGPDDSGLQERMSEFLLKAARENKLRTSWVDQKSDYETGLADFAAAAFGSADFAGAFETAATPFIRVGERKSLVQLGLKLFAPGIPDIYQGTEFADLSLVDPDNRRPVDFALRQKALEGAEDRLAGFDRRKLDLMKFGLEVRRRWPDLFGAPYQPVYVPGEPGSRFIGFSRSGGGVELRFAADLSGRGELPDTPPDNRRLMASFPASGKDEAGLSITISS